MMRRVCCVFLLLASASLLATRLSQAGSTLSVDETATRLLFRDGKAEMSLAVRSSLSRPVVARVQVELIDELNRAVAKVERGVTLNPGINSVTAEFKLEPTLHVLWRRLRYKVSPAPFSLAAFESTGVISLSQICPDVFQLSLIKPIMTAIGARYHVRVRAEQPVTLHPIEGVQVTAELVFEDHRKSLKTTGTTDREGYASIDFDLPTDVKSDGEIKLAGTRNGLSANLEGEIRIDRTTRVSLSTDKSIYEPGQALHVRVLAIKPSKHALGGTELTLKILDPEDTVVHRASLKTSRFGVASDDWNIPANTRLGDYEIKIDRDESDEEDVYSPRCQVRISRYELPNFTVSVNPDRGFYTPGQNAAVEVRGEYLFGQPVTRGHVRVVRETNREWNYREQKWKISEEEKYEGDLDGSGRFVANVDLSKQHEAISEPGYSQFNDAPYAAYITDLTTNRTEQRRFDLRVTREPIHVYVIDDGAKVPGVPFDMYVSTSYADGTPAECDVEISQDLSSQVGGVRIDRSRAIKTVRTNRYGVARASGITIAETSENSSASRRFCDAELDFVARDRVGRQGHTSETVWYGSHDFIRVQTDKALYKPGESIQLETTATSGLSTLFIDVARGWRILKSQTISLADGHRHLTLPYNKEFTDEVSIIAYGYTDKSDFNVGIRTVLFPRRHDLKLDVNMSEAQYRPGEQAAVALQIRNGNGSPTESALGVTVIDRAVEERARTDSDFGGRYDFNRLFQQLWGRGQEIAGVTLKSLEELDLSNPIPADLQLAAEILLLRRGYGVDERGSSIGNPQNEFERILNAQLRPVKSALETRYAKRRQYPTNASMLTRELAAFGLDFRRMLDPWGRPYIPKFSVSRDRDLLTLMTAGPDKRAGTHDDFIAMKMSWQYFRTLGEIFDRAVKRYHEHTGGFIRDRRSLKRELLADSIDIDALRDRWGKPYRFDFGVSDNYFTVEVKSGGADRSFDGNENSGVDDFSVWTSKIDYFAGTRVKINLALANYFRITNRFPQNEGELSEALSRASIDWDNLRDPWGNRYYATFKEESRYRDQVRIISFAQYLGEARQRTEITPVTQRVNFIYLRSDGKDGKAGTPDDFEAADYSRVVAEQAAKDPDPAPPITTVTHSGAKGAIAGKVLDSIGAIIANAKVKATEKRSGRIFETATGSEGQFILESLSAGLYDLRIDSPGFKSMLIMDVPVSSSTVTEVNITLQVGNLTETVDVTAGAVATVQTSSSSLSAKVPSAKTNFTTVKQQTQASTPRLREYFPETLVWQPLIETDTNGVARLNFKLADNITTWKMSVVASSEDGEIGTAEKEFLAFQPFFIEHDPPRVLTEGDEIALPVVLRNYLDKKQPVDVEIKPEPWFALLGPSHKRSEIPAGEAAREVFDFRAVASVDSARQRVTASASDANDSIEKPVTVHPNGQELTQAASQVFSDAASLKVTVSEAAIAGSARAELKIYPNLMSHVIESVEGIMKRPYGCAEQTISSAYPSLLFLRHLNSKEEQTSALVKKARRYVEQAYERLLNYRDEDGGFTYWGSGESDPALTAYALRFFSDAREVIPVDEDLLKQAREWLIKHQRLDGSWPCQLTTQAERLPTASRTAFIARVISSTSKSDDEAFFVAAMLKRSMNFLRQRIEEIDEPYLIASYALAAMNTGEKEGAARAIEKLRSLVHDERDASYWELQTNTPFYGWGIAGRVEATALAVQALASSEDAGVRLSLSSKGDSRSVNDLLNRGLLFLLRQKDCQGVWYSTQATVNVLDSLMTVLGKREPSGSGVDSPAEVYINAKRVASIVIPSAAQLSEPISTDISKFLSSGENRIEIHRSADSAQASAQVVESHYEPWPAESATRDSASAGALLLRVSYDKPVAKIGDEITCKVHAERVGFRGYGMLLAEIGLPPGADVDRASLDRAVKGVGWDVYQYDVLPDRLIVYLWPQAGGTHFEFKFRPRFGISALTAPSLVYDYYNPEARAAVAPTRVVIK